MMFKMINDMKDLLYYTTEEENEKMVEYYEFCKAFDEFMTEDDDDNFTGDIIRSSRTETIKEQPIKKNRNGNR